MYTYEILSNYFENETYSCTFNLKLYSRIIPLNIKSTSGEITDKEINIFIQENIDTIRFSLYNDEKNSNYDGLCQFLNKNKIYFDEFDFKITSIN